MTALLRASTLFQIIFSDPLRWLAGKSGELDEWSIVSLGESLDATEEALTAIAADGSALLDPALDPFAAIAAKQPAFADWRKKRMERTQLAPDGKTPHTTLALALAEALSPKLQGNLDATPRVIALAQAMAQRGLQKLHCKKVLTMLGNCSTYHVRQLCSTAEAPTADPTAAPTATRWRWRTS